jgi:DNA-binding Xre family transcriptional regulator
MARKPAAENLESLILAVGIGYTEVAERAGMSPRTLLAMRHGDDRTWRVATVAKLAKALGVEPARVRAAIEASRAVGEG